MQLLEIRRLTAAESEIERSQFTKWDDPSDRSFVFPSKIRAAQLMRRLGIAKSTLHEYRQIALAHCEEYIDESRKNNPGYWAGFNNVPDKPPFNRRQAEILREIRLLFAVHGDRCIVIEILELYNKN